MRIIKLDATDSTNSYLRNLSVDDCIEDYTVVTAKKQTHGRGQIGAVWESESSKNLTFSVFRDLSKLHLEHPFFISIVASLSVLKALQSFNIEKLSVKWPNDILSENKKVCGILIENVIKQNSLNSSIIGIGLNVNQTVFPNLPLASSLKLITGITYPLDEVLMGVISNLKHCFSLLENGKHEVFVMEYERNLYRKNIPSSFRGADGTLFTGIIKGISKAGNLKVLVEDAGLKEFDLKEITLLY